MYSIIIGSFNNWIIMIFLYDVKDEEYYKHINITILDGNVMNVYLIVMEGNYGSIDADDCLWHGYYIIKFYSYPYTLQADFSIGGKVISSIETVCEETYLFIHMYSRYYALQ